MNKVFGIGMSKTGTSTLGACFEVLGLTPTCGWDGNVKSLVQGHRVVDPINLKFSYDPLDPIENKLVLKDIFDVVDQYKSFQDTPWYIIYSVLDKQYPNSKFILTVRKDSYSQAVSDWQHNARHGRCSGDAPEWFIEKQSGIYEAHNKSVQEYFRRRPDDLLVVCWEGGSGWEDLCNFLGLPVPNVPFPHENPGDY